MKKIDLKYFFGIIGIDQEIIPPTSAEDVTEFKIGKRFVYSLKPRSPLLSIHDALRVKFLDKVPISNSAKAFKEGSSYFHYIEPHRINFNFLRLDLKTFFHSIQEDKLRDIFSSYIDNAYVERNKQKQSLVDCFTKLVTYKISDNSKNLKFVGQSILPMGFKTSPVISNIVFRKIDIIIQKQCIENGITYTRYADDMLFSSEKNNIFITSHKFIQNIREILGQDQFKLNEKKTICKKHIISLNGYVIEGSRSDLDGGRIRLSNKKTNLLKKLIYELDEKTPYSEILRIVFGFDIATIQLPFRPLKQEFIDKYCKDQLVNKIVGYRSYLLSFLKFHDEHKCANENSIEKYGLLVKRLEKHINIIMNS